MQKFFGFLMFFAALAWTHPAAASPADTMASVVAVLPDWPNPRSGQALQEPEGSAVAVLKGGYFATASHVLGRAKTLNIRLANGRIQKADIVARDVRTDIALLKVEGDFPVPEIAAAPLISERVCAIGNQFGLGISLTCGVVSALGVSNAGFNPIEDFIQTDAAMNPGSSGGALVDSRGRLVGLLSAIFTKQSDASIGVNFAVSADLLMRVVTDLRDHGRVRSGYARWRLARLSKDDRRTVSGARVVAVQPDGPADDAGILVGDVITSLDDRDAASPADVRAAIYMRRPGDQVTLTLSRGGESLTKRITLND